MNLLLHTRTLLWWLADDPLLTAQARQAIANAESLVHVSSVSLWEIGIKKGLGKLTLSDDFDEVLSTQGFRELSISWQHAQENRSLPWLHRDPFDRMLIAQAISDGLTLVTSDSEIRQYTVDVL